jgi:hypothetical protein
MSYFQNTFNTLLLNACDYVYCTLIFYMQLKKHTGNISRYSKRSASYITAIVLILYCEIS